MKNPSCVNLPPKLKEKAKEISKSLGGNRNKQFTVSHGVQVAVENYKIK